MQLRRVSQEDLARLIREDPAGNTRGCNRAMVDRWVRGITRCPQPRYLSALERALGMAAEDLGFALPVAPALTVHKDLDGVTADAAAMQAFRKADLRVGGGHLYAAVAQYLRAQVAPRLVMANGKDVFTSAAAVSEMAGWMAHDAGSDRVARQHLSRALDLVSVSGDRQVTAHVLASTGHVAHHLGEPAETLRVSQAGLEVIRSGPCDPGLEAYLLAIRARGFAALREPAEAARCLREAEKALQAGRGQPCSPWVSRFDQASLASEAARCMRQLGQLSEARRQAETVVALRPADRPRSRAFGMFVQAGVLAANRRPDEAAVIGGEILQATDGLSSQTIVQEFLALRRLLGPYRPATVVAQFLDHLDYALCERSWQPADLNGVT